MQSSPPRSEGKARALRELTRSSYSTRSIPSPSLPLTDSNPTQQFDDISDFFNNDEIHQSTQHRFEDLTNNTLPHVRQYPQIRSTAKKQGRWTMNPPERPIPDTSMVAKEFLDFDNTVSDQQEDISIEQGRGGQRSNRSTPGKVNSTFGEFNSLYDMTPPSARTRKSNASHSGNLRRDAQLRRASRNDFDTASPRPASTRNSPAVSTKPKRTSLAQSHAKISEDESSFIEQRPPTMSLPAKSTRWGGPRSREHSLQLDGAADRPPTAQTGTVQSFMLPDLPNLTELVSGVFEDGTPVFSKTTPARSRFAAPNKKGRGGRQPNYIPVDSVPIPDEEKAIFASLQLLQERVAQLETERAEAEKKVEEQEIEIIELRAANQRPGSGHGTDGDSAKNNWKVEKARLEASVQTLQKKLERSERKLSVSDIEKTRLQKERDSMQTQLAVAFQNFDELKSEKEALSTENDTLRQEVDSLRDQLDQEQQQYREETLQLRRQVDRAENVTQREADTLRLELSRVRAQHDENTQRLARKEAELRKAKKEQAEYAKLKADNDFIKEQLAELKAKREHEARRWSSREHELKDRIGRRDETIRHFQDMTQEQTNEAMRIDNDNLRHELAQLAAEHEDEAERWAKREEQLRRKIDVAHEKEGLTREILSVRQASNQYNFAGPSSGGKENAAQETTAPALHRRPSARREDTRTRIANRVQQEVRNNRPTSSSQLEKSARKSYPKMSTSMGAHTSRSASAPVYNKNRAEVDSDVESTTDLSLAPRDNPYSMHGGATGMSSVSAVEPPAPLDLTELSYIDAEQIAQLRRALEEERAGLRARRPSTTGERQTREDTVRSAVSAKSTRQQSLPRKSSMKDVTERTGTVLEDFTQASNRDAEPTQTGQTDADASMVSNTSRRRRSMATENMTSAFIVPDLKITSRIGGTTKIDITEKVNDRSHDNDNCMVCRREASNPPTNTLQIPKLVPVSSRMPDEPDATMRPSVSPKEALALVVKELCDERAHLHMELAAARAMLEAHDVSQGMKKRNQINDVIKEVLRLIEVKDTQIYHLYDVLEGQNDHEITEHDVEELTREIRFEDDRHAAPEKERPTTSEKEKKSKGKKVTVRSFHESEEDVELSADEEDLPWEGFEDTASRSINVGSFGGRGSVY